LKLIYKLVSNKSRINWIKYCWKWYKFYNGTI